MAGSIGDDARASARHGVSDAPARWRRVKAIFSEALERAEPERAPFLDAACGDDARLRTDVQALLESDRHAGDFCEIPAAALLPDILPATAPHRLRPGSRLGPYEIAEFVGAGGMGEVYRARDGRLTREVAIKTVGSHLPDAEGAARLLKEARHAAILTHPNICTVYEVGDDDGTSYIVMEYVRGKSLATWLRDRPLPIPDAVACAIQIADALAHAHARGVAHRDLKSSNIVLDETGKATVLDFGLARRLPQADVRSVESFTTADALAGTLSYMAPEVLLGGALDPRSDIWALGILLFEMTMGRLPFGGRTPFETSSSIIGDPLPPLPRRLPIALRLVIQRCLMKDPAARYATASDAAAALRAIGGRAAWRVIGGAFVSSRRALMAAAGTAIGLALVASTVEPLRNTLIGSGAPQARTLALLPFETVEGRQDVAYYAQGINDALAAQLGSLTGVRVIARSSTERAARNAQPDQIARAVGADVLVGGELLVTGDRVQLDVRMFEARTGRIAWSDRFNRPMREVLALQAEVVRALTAAIHLSLPQAARDRLMRVRAVNPDAYEAYLKGRYLWNARTADSVAAAVKQFRRALELDPTFAPAHAALADCYNQQATLMIGVGSPRDLRPLAAAAAIRALQIDPDASEPHAALGFVRHYQWQWDEAEQEFRRAIELNPSNALARIWYANMLMSRRRMDEALQQVFLARALDPFSLIVNTNVAWVQIYAGRADEAIEQLARTLALDPEYTQARWRLVKALIVSGRYGEAVREAARAAEITQRSPPAVSVLAVSLAHANRTREARALLRELLDTAGRQYVSPGSIADVYVALGELDPAFVWMEKAFDEQSNWVAYIAGDPANRAFWNDPRFQSLLRRTGLD